MLFAEASVGSFEHTLAPIMCVLVGECTLKEDSSAGDFLVVHFRGGVFISGVQQKKPQSVTM